MWGGGVVWCGVVQFCVVWCNSVYKSCWERASEFDRKIGMIANVESRTMKIVIRICLFRDSQLFLMSYGTINIHLKIACNLLHVLSHN